MPQLAVANGRVMKPQGLFPWGNRRGNGAGLQPYSPVSVIFPVK